MPDEPDVPALMARVGRGDPQAAEELFRRYEARVRLEVRTRLRDPRLRRLIDEADVCQSVLRSFFIRARLGEYDLADPQELLRLLAGMARNKLAAQARRHSAECRDFRRSANLEGAVGIPAPGETPSQLVAGEELLREVRARLDEEERYLADLRAAGRSWAEIAQLLGGSADARRMQMQRAATRVSRELGLEEDDE
jgi:RNA polymerase sigma-70 factor (ECF subfamily)